MGKERPILFSTPMVQAILEGRKTMTRRIVTKNNSYCGSLLTGDGQGWHSFDFNDVVIDGKTTIRQYLKVAVPVNDTRHRIFHKWDIGDTLWVRETWQFVDFGCESEQRGYVYKASENGQDWASNDEEWKWKPSIFMPKEACRILLEITRIRVERLHHISKEDVFDEGVPVTDWPVSAFKALWKSINGQDSWDLNPWVWVIEFKPIPPTPNGTRE